ncbi:MAG: hypothetical protein JNK53_01540 [Phycisphaerae bacterium]|nr:hypothetical protein [Phycisphaerae bacterium]
MPHVTARRAGATVLSLLATFTGAATTASAAIVQSFDVGTGASTSTVQVDFSNGNGYLFTLHYSGSLTGLGALQLMAAEVPSFTLQTDSFPWGELVSGLGVGSDFEYGTGDLWPIENYWHYWVHNDAYEWAWSPEGATDRQLFNGSADAWVFGTGVPPQPIPGAPVLALATLFVRVGSRSRRQRRH